MMKAAACILILLSSLLTGLTVSARLSRRVAYLDAALRLVSMIETRMSCFLEPLDPLLAVLHVGSPLMKNAPEGSFFDAWKAVFSARDLPIRESDRALLLSFGASLGASDLAGQRALCADMRARLNTALDGAREEKRRFARLGAALPVFAGAAVVILCI